MGESIEVLHEEFRTHDGRDAVLPPAAARAAVRVDLPSARLPYEDRVEALLRGPLGRLEPDTLYYVRGTRLMLWTGGMSEASAPPVAGPDAFHGTAVTGIAAGRTTGTAPDSLVVVALVNGEAAWNWLADQPWIDLATTSGFSLGGAAPVLCEGVRGAEAFRATGRLPYMIAGNGFFETLAFSPGHSASIVRVGGVHSDGTPYLAQESTNYSSHGYDLAESWSHRVAASGSDDGYTTAGGTSGSTPKVAGRAAALLRHVRVLLRDAGTGAREGALAVAGPGAKRFASGPLADGRLTADELLRVQLLTSRPSLSVEGARYAHEGYGWFDGEAEAQARAVLEGRVALPERPLDEQAHAAALAARDSSTTARGCTLPPPFAQR
jgi:hypothetical protein